MIMHMNTKQQPVPSPLSSSTADALSQISSDPGPWVFCSIVLKIFSPLSEQQPVLTASKLCSRASAARLRLPGASRQSGELILPPADFKALGYTQHSLQRGQALDMWLEHQMNAGKF